MRRRLVALAATTTIMVALAFLIPLAVLVRTLARDRALSAAELEAQSLAPVLALSFVGLLFMMLIGYMVRVLMLKYGVRVGRKTT